MYYIYNLENLGKTKIITYSNMFINNLMFGCKYKNQEYVNNLAPNIEEENSQISWIYYTMN